METFLNSLCGSLTKEKDACYNLVNKYFDYWWELVKNETVSFGREGGEEGGGERGGRGEGREGRGKGGKGGNGGERGRDRGEGRGGEERKRVYFYAF